MRMLHNARLGAKLSLIIGTAILLIAVLGVGGIVASGQMQGQTRVLIDQKLIPARAMSDMRSTLGGMQTEYNTLSRQSANGSWVRTQLESREHVIQSQLQILHQAGSGGEISYIGEWGTSGCPLSFWTTDDTDGDDDTDTRCAS